MVKIRLEPFTSFAYIECTRPGPSGSSTSCDVGLDDKPGVAPPMLSIPPSPFGGVRVRVTEAARVSFPFNTAGGQGPHG